MKDVYGLVRKFWKGEAAEIDKLRLFKRLHAEDPDLQQQFQSAPGAPGDPALEPGLSTEESSELLQTLHSRIGKPVFQLKEAKPRQVLKLLRWSVVAATLSGVILLSYYWKSGVEPKVPARASIGALAAVRDTVRNDGSTVKAAVLPDGTAIRLYPHSMVSYDRPMGQSGTRQIALAGKAVFTVKHNAGIPFEVVASGIRTVDIGTEFCINASQRDQVSIHLKEGKISVEALPQSHMQLMKLVLSPGDKLLINLANNTAQLRSPHDSMLRAQEGHSPAIRHQRQPLEFNKTPMPRVLAALSRHFGIKIISENPADLEELTFTGKIEASDSLETSLTILCSMSGLSYRQTSTGFTVYRNSQ